MTGAGGALAAEEFPYQVKIKGFNGQPVSIGFDNKTDLEDYLKKHPVPHCHKAKFLWYPQNEKNELGLQKWNILCVKTIKIYISYYSNKNNMLINFYIYHKKR